MGSKKSGVTLSKNRKVKKKTKSQPVEIKPAHSKTVKKLTKMLVPVVGIGVRQPEVL